VPVTSVPRTLIDVAEVVSIRSLERMLDEAEFLRLLDLARLDVTLERHRGRPGSARVRSLLEHHQPGSTRTRNALEERFLLIVREAGLPQPEVNQELGSYEADFTWRDARLVVETDGGASHDRHSQRERDGRRDAGLAIDGYRTERFTYDQVMNRPAEVTAVLETLLRAGTFQFARGGHESGERRGRELRPGYLLGGSVARLSPIAVRPVRLLRHALHVRRAGVRNRRGQ